MGRTRSATALARHGRRLHPLHESSYTARTRVAGPIAALVRPIHYDGGLVVAGERDIQLLDEGGTRCLVELPLPLGVRCNEGACDPRAASTSGQSRTTRSPDAARSSVTGRGEVNLILGDLTIANGLAFSPDGVRLRRLRNEANRPTRIRSGRRTAALSEAVHPHRCGGGSPGWDLRLRRGRRLASALGWQRGPALRRRRRPLCAHRRALAARYLVRLRRPQPRNARHHNIAVLMQSPGLGRRPLRLHPWNQRTARGLVQRHALTTPLENRHAAS